MFNRLLSDWTITGFDGSLPSISEKHLKYVSLNNRPCQGRPKLVDINYNKTVSANKYGGSCNTTDCPYAMLCLPNKVKIRM